MSSQGVSLADVMHGVHGRDVQALVRAMQEGFEYWVIGEAARLRGEACMYRGREVEGGHASRPIVREKEAMRLAGMVHALVGLVGCSPW